MSVIRLSAEGEAQVKFMIDRLEGKNAELNRDKGKAMETEMHTALNVALHAAKDEQQAVNRQLAEAKRVRDNHVRVDAHGDPARVDLGDIVTVYNKTIDDEYQVVVTGKWIPDTSATDVDEVTLNSPLGEAIYGQEKGAEVVCSVRSQAHTIVVKDFEKPATVKETSADDTKDLK